MTRRQTAPGREVGKISPDGQQRLLRGILGEFDVAQDPVRHPVEPATHGDGEARECLFVTVLGPHHEIGIHSPPPRRPMSSASSLRMGVGTEDATQ